MVVMYTEDDLIRGRESLSLDEISFTDMKNPKEVFEKASLVLYVSRSLQQFKVLKCTKSTVPVGMQYPTLYIEDVVTNHWNKNTDGRLTDMD